MGAVASRVQLRELRRLAISRWAVLFALTSVGGVVLRVWVYRSVLGIPNSDEAVVGLMSRHALHGDFTTFFWGQYYGGTQEPLLTAPVFYVFGSSWLALRIVPIVLSGVADARRVGLFGLVFGLAFWETAQIVPIAAPLVAWTIWKQPLCLRRLWAALPLAAIGALPWIVWNAEHDWRSVDVSYGVDSTYWHRLRVFVSPLMPMMIGLRELWTQTRILPAALTLLVYSVLVAGFVYGAIKTRHRTTSVLYVVAIAFPFLYAISQWTLESGEPRYLVVLTPVLALLLAQVATRYWAAVAVTALAGALSVVVLHRAAIVAAHPNHDTPPAAFRPLISTLDRLGVHRVYASFWIAYRLSFETRERIIAVKNDFTGVSWDGSQAQPKLGTFIRYPPFERKVRAGRHAFVFYRDTLASVRIVPKLEQFGYRRYPTGPLVVFWLPPGR